ALPRARIFIEHILICYLWTDAQTGIWAGGRTGLIYISQDRSTWEVIAAPDSLAVHEVYHITTDQEGYLWLSAQSGLYQFDRVKRKYLARFHNKADVAYFLPSSTFYFTHIDPEGIFWLGTDDGLIRWNKKGEDYQLFTTADGLSNNVIYTVLADQHQQLWLSSDYGLMQFDTATQAVRSYLTADGIAHEEFNKTSFHQTADGTIFLGGLNGITAFHPDDFQQKEQAFSAPLFLTKFEVFDGEEGLLKNKFVAVKSTGKLNLYPTDRYLRLSFALLSMTDTERNTYAWKLDGIDQDWNYQKENTIQFGKLPYGKQTLRIKGQAANGQWSTKELVYELNVLPPFYLRTWFILLFLSVTTTIVALFFRNRTRRYQQSQKMLKAEIQKATRQIQTDKALIEEQAKELQQLDQLKSRFFANVSHELRTPLSLMLGPIRRLNRPGKTKEAEQHKLLGFLERSTLQLQELVNEILDLSKLENNKMELKEEATLFHHFLTNHLHQFYSIGNSEHITIKQQTQIPMDFTILLDQSKFKKILNNFLSNALKFSPTYSQITISAEVVEDAQILIAVQDQGRGIHPQDLPYVFDRFYQAKKSQTSTAGGTGIGLSMCRELAQLMGGKVWADSVLDEGSIFCFQFPVQQTKAVVSLESNRRAIPRLILELLSGI
ncbi:MAG: ATP-binding protein, partial [Bacteroidota bacterium]